MRITIEESDNSKWILDTDSPQTSAECKHHIEKHICAILDPIKEMHRKACEQNGLSVKITAVE